MNTLFCEKKWKSAKKAGCVDLGMRSLTLAGYLGIILLLLYSMMEGSISIGAFAAVFSSITTLITFMNDAIGNHLGSLFDNFGFVKKYFEFFDLPEETSEEGEIGWHDKVEVSHVSFCYPGTDQKVLEDVSFEIQRGKPLRLWEKMAREKARWSGSFPVY